MGFHIIDISNIFFDCISQHVVQVVTTSSIMPSSLTPLPVGVGYGVVVGIGFFFALVMCGISYIQVCDYTEPLVSYTKTRQSRIDILDFLQKLARNSIPQVVASSQVSLQAVCIFLYEFSRYLTRRDRNCVSMDLGSDVAVHCFFFSRFKIPLKSA